MVQEARRSVKTEAEVRLGPHQLPGTLMIPADAKGLVLFAHGSGSSRLSPRNQYVAAVLQSSGFATLLFDLLTEVEGEDRDKVFDIELLSERLQEAADWACQQPESLALPIGYFGASTGAAAALVAAARHPEQVKAVVSRGGRPDLAGSTLEQVTAPTLLIVGAADRAVLEMNRHALQLLPCEKRLEVVAGASHLFPEPGTLELAARHACDWFEDYLDGVPANSKAQAHRHQDPSRPQPGDEDPDPVVRDRPMFRDREDAARQLAAQFKGIELHDPLVLGIPRGGVVTGAVLARELGAELDIALSRKLRAPFQPELAVGAVGEDGHVYLNAHTAEAPGITAGWVERERRYQLAEIERRRTLFRAARPAATVKGRTVIVTDDGIATGSTMMAALQVVRNQEPHELVVAVPVAPPDRLDLIRQCCDRLICLATPADFWAVGQFYRRFEQIEDEQVLELLRQFTPVKH